MLLIYLVNDLQMSRKQLFHKLYRPALQGLWEHRVVGVCKGLLGDLPGLREGRGVSCFPVQEACPAGAHPITQDHTLPQLLPVCNSTAHSHSRTHSIQPGSESSRDWEYGFLFWVGGKQPCVKLIKLKTTY